MRLPLFVAATPQPNLKSPSVLIGKGSWRLVSTHANSKLEFTTKDPSNDSFSIRDGKEHIVVESGLLEVWCEVKEAGRESITVFIERAINASEGTV